MREIVLGVAKAGVFEPYWSDRILQEWALAAAKLGQVQADVAQGEVALLRAKWPEAAVTPHMAVERDLSLPDDNDVHVLAAAIAAKSDVVMTMNLRDFPRATLARFDMVPLHPDAFLMAELDENRAAIARVVEAVRKKAEELSGEPQEIRKLLKRARMPRLGKALAA